MSETPIPFPQKGVPDRRFKPGQIVWLKSGSPAMTVNDLGNPPSVTVDWFDVDHMACRDAFHHDQLTLAPRVYPSSVVVPEIADAMLRHGDAVATKPKQDNGEKPSG